MRSKQNKDLSIIVTSFYMKIVGFWVTTNYVEKRWRIFAMMYTVVALVIAVMIETRDFYFTWGDTGESIYITCNLVNLVLVLLKIFISSIHKKELFHLIRYAETNFWHSNYDAYEQMVVDTCKRACTYLVCIFTFFTQATVMFYVIRPIIVNIGKNESDRILPFNLWLNLPLSMTPYFEVAFIIEVLTVYHVGVCYLCFDNFLCLMNMHTASQFRILQYRFTNICSSDNNEERDKYSGRTPYRTFKSCIRQHQTLIAYCDRVEKVFTLIILGQVFFFSLLICLDGYLTVMEGYAFTRRLIFAFHLITCSCQLLMFTYSCDCLIRESVNVANAVYDGPWPILSMDRNGRMLRKDMLLIIMRASRPCCLTASGFFVVSLETYTRIWSTAVSYFTLLRNQVATEA